MEVALFLRSLYALCVVGVLLLALWWVSRTVGRKRIMFSAGRRIVTVIETTYLSQQAVLHVVKVADRYLLLSSGNGGVHKIDDVDGASIADRIEEQQRVPEDPTLQINQFFRKLRGPK